MKIEGSGSISQRHGSADPDPDPHQNVTDPEHCLPVFVIHFIISLIIGTIPVHQGKDARNLLPFPLQYT
jgi:hypothetical protein